jgi:acetyl esterase/lipase
MLPPLKYDRVAEADIHIPPADVTHIRRKWLDIPYANLSAAQKLDLYLPDEGDGPFPVLIHVHGGAFAIGDKRDIHLTPFLRGFARYHLDGERIAAWGGSAGGNLAAMACLTANVSIFDDPDLASLDVPCNVQVAVDWFGPTDFLSMDAQLADSGLGPCDHSAADSPESRYLGGKITQIPLKVELANPMTYIHETMPPILIQHGRLDHLVPVQQSIIFAHKLAKYVSPDRFEFDILENADHADPLFETEANLHRVFSFLARHLK